MERGTGQGGLAQCISAGSLTYPLPHIEPARLGTGSDRLGVLVRIPLGPPSLYPLRGQWTGLVRRLPSNSFKEMKKSNQSDPTVKTNKGWRD